MGYVIEAPFLIKEIKEDEDRKIEKLEAHKKLKQMVIKIGISENINVNPTYGDDPNGDLVLPYDEKEKLEKALDKYIGKHKIKYEGNL